MVEDFGRKIQKGLGIFRDGVNTVSDIINTGDKSIKTLDDALRGNAPPPEPEQAFTNVMAHLISMREMARGGFANTPAVAQKAREIIGMVNQVPLPSWKEMTNIRTRDDMVRLAMRDLRSSQALMKLASGQGTAEDINALINWMNQVSGKVQTYPSAPAQAPEPAATSEAGVPGMGHLPGQVTTEATIEHQHKEMRKHMLLLEGHLQQKCKIGGIACDCCEKHPIIIQGLAEEAIGMTNNPIYSRIMAWCNQVTPITTEAASASGQYDEQYPNMAIELRELRKSLPS